MACSLAIRTTLQSQIAGSLCGLHSASHHRRPGRRRGYARATHGGVKTETHSLTKIHLKDMVGTARTLAHGTPARCRSECAQRPLASFAHETPTAAGRSKHCLVRFGVAVLRASVTPPVRVRLPADPACAHSTTPPSWRRDRVAETPTGHANMGMTMWLSTEHPRRRGGCGID